MKPYSIPECFKVYSELTEKVFFIIPDLIRDPDTRPEPAVDWIGD